jgi:hypothetical protein
MPALGATKALRNGTVDAMIAGSVHDVVVALSQRTPWLLVVRAVKEVEAALEQAPDFGSADRGWVGRNRFIAPISAANGLRCLARPMAQ